jgi:hypothetical protein
VLHLHPRLSGVCGAAAAEGKKVTQHSECYIFILVYLAFVVLQLLRVRRLHNTQSASNTVILVYLAFVLLRVSHNRINTIYTTE